MNVLCLFEQSGTFKAALQERGHSALDCDMDNMFGQTDIIGDIFKAIESGELSILLDSADVVFAFFPCTWFSAQNDLLINGTSHSMKNWTEERKKEYAEKRLSDRDRAANVLRLLTTYCYNTRKPLIVENPAGKYIKSVLGEPTVSHKRGLYGDWYNKPTYWYLYNCSFDNNKLKRIDNLMEHTIVKQPHHSDKQRKINRSLISPVYVRNFINCLILGGVSNGKTL